MSLDLLVGFLLPIAGTAALIRLGAPALWLRSRTLVLSLAVVVALGLSSLLFALSTFAFGPQWSPYVLCDAALWTLALSAALLGASGRQSPQAAARPLTRRELMAAMLFGITLTVSLLHLYWYSANFPSGAWDAQAIWTLHARFLHRGLEGHWRDGFQAVLGWSLPDYPLMLPANIARLWLYAESEPPLVPIIIAALFKYATVGMIVGGLMAASRRCEAFCAGAVVLASFTFNQVGAGQISDVPLGAFVLASTILLSWVIDQASQPDSGSAMVILAFCAGCAAWTKNEGLVFALTISASLAFLIFWRNQVVARTVLPVAAGLLLPVAALSYFKGNIAPPNYLLDAGTLGSRASHLLDLERHTYILRSFVRELWSWNTSRPIGVIPFVVAYGIATAALRGVRHLRLLTVVPLIAMLCGYYASYVLTPFDLKWHIASSLTRLIVQIWPAAVYVCFALAEPGPMPGAAHTGLSIQPSEPQASASAPVGG